MPEKQLRVELLSMTSDPLPLIYAAFRQCYHDGYVADMWPRLVSGEIDREKQADFVAKVLESGHDSPIEHVSFSFAVEGISRACSHQVVRHRIASYSQQSQRYCTEGEDFEYIEPPAIKKIPEAHERFLAFVRTAGEAYADMERILREAGRADKAAEDARFLLPNAAETKIVISMNCRALLHFFHLRCCMRAQWEVRRMANAMLALCKAALSPIFATAGPRCEALGYCPESDRFSCGRYPNRSQVFGKGS